MYRYLEYSGFPNQQLDFRNFEKREREMLVGEQKVLLRNKIRDADKELKKGERGREGENETEKGVYN